MSKQVKTELQKYIIYIEAIPETRWMGSGVLNTGNFISMCTGNENNTF
jgi:hypothetical protein